MSSRLPEHLRRYPCMQPWIGSEYRESRILVVGESHYMPEGSTINLHPESWYNSTQENLADCELAYIHTVKCVEYRLSGEGRATLRNNAYVRINRVVPFNQIAFFNYFFRPASYKQGIGSVGIEQSDLKVSQEIMRWFVKQHQPRLVIVASKLAGGYTGPVLGLDSIRCCVVCHPMHKFGVPFRTEAERCLSRLSAGITSRVYGAEPARRFT